MPSSRASRKVRKWSGTATAFERRLRSEIDETKSIPVKQPKKASPSTPRGPMPSSSRLALELRTASPQPAPAPAPARATTKRASGKPTVVPAQVAKPKAKPPAKPGKLDPSGNLHLASILPILRHLDDPTLRALRAAAEHAVADPEAQRTSLRAGTVKVRDAVADELRRRSKGR
jgi:hypothetical protein